MRVLLIGSGGREHALFLKLQQSSEIEKLLILPGNGGIDDDHSYRNIDVNDFEKILAVIEKENITMVVVGPEQPLVAGLKNFLKEKAPQVLFFGPDEHAAKLEGSKVFAHQFMQAQNIPVPESKMAHSLEQAKDIIATHSLPVVIKADGLAAGKGVSIHEDRDSAYLQVEKIFNDRIFGDAGNQVLFQSFLQGTEASIFAICNGKEAIYLPPARDYKPAYDDNLGPNTGGMGSYCPSELISSEQIDFVHKAIVQKVLDEFNYTGILYVGLMIHSDRPDDMSVVEFNCRLGDPETQSVLPLIEPDLLPYLKWAASDDDNITVPRVEQGNHYIVPVKAAASINVVLAAKGYPGSYEKEVPLALEDELPENAHVVYAGTALKDGKKVSSGGRIASLVVVDKTLDSARKTVYSLIENLKKTNDFSRLHYRTDIGKLR